MLCVVVYQEALDGRIGKYDVEIVLRPGWNPGRVPRIRVVARDATANHDTGAHRDPAETVIEYAPADIVEENVDTIGSQLPQAGTDLLAFVVNGGVESQLLDEPLAFARAARNPDHLATGKFADLTHYRTYCACRTRDDQHIARARLADMQQPEIGSFATDTEHPQCRTGG